MEFIYTFQGITLYCSIEHVEDDRWSHTNGHYTTMGEPYVETAIHNGEDILELLSDDVVDDILATYKKEQNNDL
jgi:hypothetical protein